MKLKFKSKELTTILRDKNKEEIKNILGYGKYHSEFNIWSYDIMKNWFFRREMLLFFSDCQLTDIQITDYWLGNKFREYFY